VATLPYLALAKRIVVLSCLIAATYQDIKTREVDDLIWITMICLTTPLVLFELFTYSKSVLVTYIISTLLTAVLSFLLAYFGLMGGADAKAYICLSIAELPEPTVIDRTFPGISIFINSVILSALTSLLIFAKNVKLMYTSSLTFPQETNILKKLILLFTSTMINIKELERNPHKYFVLNTANNKIDINIRLARQNTSEIIPLLKKRNVKRVWVTPALPFILFILLGYMFYMLLGNIVFILFK